MKRLTAAAVVLTCLATAACGQKPAEAPTDGDSVRERAQEAQTARRRTGAEAQATTRRFLELEGAIEAAQAAALPGVSGVEVVSERDGVRVLKAALGQGGRGQEALKAAFLGGLDVRRFELREPSLHDAFISLTGDNPDIDQSVKAGAEAAR